MQNLKRYLHSFKPGRRAGFFTTKNTKSTKTRKIFLVFVLFVFFVVKNPALLPGLKLCRYRFKFCIWRYETSIPFLARLAEINSEFDIHSICARPRGEPFDLLQCVAQLLAEV